MNDTVCLISKENLEAEALVIEMYVKENYSDDNAVSFIKNKNENLIVLKTKYLDICAEALAKWIVGNSLISFIFDIVNEELLYILNDDDILNVLNDTLNSPKAIEIKNKLKDTIINFGEDFSEIQFDGFMRFCASGYIKELYKLLYKAYLRCVTEL